MEFLFPLLLSIHILVGLSVIGLVLLQHGKGADMGAAFGSGASGSLFGASGSANFLSRTTGILAAVFFVTSLGLSYLSGGKPKAPESVMEAPVETTPARGTVEVPLPAVKPDEAAGASQKPAETKEQKPAAAEDKPAAPAEEKSAVPAEQKPEAAAPATGSATADDGKATAIPDAKPEQKAAAKTEPKSSAKNDKAGAEKKAAGEASGAQSKAKEIPK